MQTDPQDFARAFGDALQRFLREKRIRQVDASRDMSIEPAALNTYLHDSRKGKRAKANAEVLVAACVQLGFQFEYKGHVISATPIAADNASSPPPFEKLSFSYANQFNLIDERGSLSVKV